MAGDGNGNGIENANANDNTSGGVRVGQSVALTTRFHGASGTVTVVDEQTLRIEAFTFDGGGIDVFIVGSPDGDFATGVKLSADLIRAGGYRNETLTLPLPAGTTLDDVRHLSVWCETAAVSFADAAFE